MRVEISDGKGKIIQVIDDGQPLPVDVKNEKIKEARAALDKIILNSDLKDAVRALVDAVEASQSLPS